MFDAQKKLVQKHSGAVAVILKDLPDKLCLATSSECVQAEKREGLFQRILGTETTEPDYDYYQFRQFEIEIKQLELQELYKGIGDLSDYLELLETEHETGEEVDLMVRVEQLGEQSDTRKKIKEKKKEYKNKTSALLAYLYGRAPQSEVSCQQHEVGTQVSTTISGKGSWLLNFLPTSLAAAGHAMAVYTTQSRDDYMLFDPDWALMIFPTPAKLGSFLQEYLAVYRSSLGPVVIAHIE